MSKQPVIRPPLPLSGLPGTELPGLGRPQFKGEHWFSQEGVHFTTDGGIPAKPLLIWQFAHVLASRPVACPMAAKRERLKLEEVRIGSGNIVAKA